MNNLVDAHVVDTPLIYGYGYGHGQLAPIAALPPS